MSEVKKITSNIKLEGARLIFRNFRGEGSQFNAEGSRNFGVLLPDDMAEELVKDGWNVKYLKPRPDDPDEYRQPWLSVKVRFGQIPPTVRLINSKGQKKLTEETIDQLDWSILKNVDLIIRPYNYPEGPGRPAGVAAYLKTLYATIQEDDFAEKYADIPDLDEREEVYEDE